MAKIFGLGGMSMSEYLKLVVDNDWKEQMGEDKHEKSIVESELDLPDERRWQFKRGNDAFWHGDALRKAGTDVSFENSRRLWRLGWVAACKEYIESTGGRFRGSSDS